MEYVEKQIRKAIFGKNKYKGKSFETPAVEYDTDEMKKLREFESYCFEKQRCLNCGSKYEDAKKEENSYKLILECGNCLSNDILSDPVSMEYTKWLDNHLFKQAGDTFERGFPRPMNLEVTMLGKGHVKVKNPKVNILKKEGKKNSGV